MESLFSEIKAELAHALWNAAKAAGYETSETSVAVEVSKAFGDVSSPIALKIAKQTRSDPASVAGKIATSVKSPEYVTRITTENGFINFHFGRTQFMDLFLNHALLEKTLRPVPLGKKAMVEFVGTNPNKPWHVGHLRNALLGESIARIYDATGYDVERQNYIDDQGFQMGEIMWWYLKQKPSPGGKKFDQWLGEEYIKLNSYLKGHEDEKTDVKKMLALMEQDGTYESNLLNDLVTECLKANYQTAFSMGVYHDVLVWERDIIREKLLQKTMDLLRNKGFAKLETEGDYNGCLVINLKESAGKEKSLSGLNSSFKVLMKSDGTATYLAKDIAFHMWKFGVLDDTFNYSLFIEKQPNGKPLYTTSKEGKRMGFGNANVAVNVIDVRQSHPQTVLRLAFTALGRGDIADNIKHVAYGEVELESGGLSGRTGNWIGYSADEILAEAITRSRKLITSRFEFGDEERERVARAVALAAIKFELLKYGIEKKIVFSWDKALNFEGGSGPYHQYMHARANRIIEEGAGIRSKPNTSEINDYEFRLAKLMAMAREMVAKACYEGRPNVITDYLNELSSEFAKFYENCPVLKAEEKKVGLRLELTRQFKETSATMLGLLGIEALQRM